MKSSGETNRKNKALQGLESSTGFTRKTPFSIQTPGSLTLVKAHTHNSSLLWPLGLTSQPGWVNHTPVPGHSVQAGSSYSLSRSIRVLPGIYLAEAGEESLPFLLVEF